MIDPPQAFVLMELIEEAFEKGGCIRCGESYEAHYAEPGQPPIKWLGDDCEGYAGKRGAGPPTVRSTDVYEYDPETRRVRAKAAPA